MSIEDINDVSQEDIEDKNINTIFLDLHICYFYNELQNAVM